MTNYTFNDNALKENTGVNYLYMKQIGEKQSNPTINTFPD